jgi:nicotinamidase-related amidase
MTIPSNPYSFPITGDFVPAKTALIIIDMQRDFCEVNGYIHTRGGDVSAARSIIPTIDAVRTAAISSGMKVIYTREGHRPDLSDLPTTKRLRTAFSGAEIGSVGPLGRLLIRGEPGWNFVPELMPRACDTVIDKPGTGAFYATDLQHVLTTQGIENLILVGVTTGVCVTSTAREGSDRGFNVLVLSDCCAEPDPEHHAMAIEMLKIEGGYIATVSSSAHFLLDVNSLELEKLSTTRF